MDITNNWTIVVGIATIISLIFYWSKLAYLDPVIDKEEDIKRKVSLELHTLLNNADDIIRKHGEIQFVDEIYDIIESRKKIHEIKFMFRSRMIPSGIGLCFLVIVLVTIWDYNILLTFTVGYAAIILLLVVIFLFAQMRRYEINFTRYLERENSGNLLL